MVRTIRSSPKLCTDTEVFEHRVLEVEDTPRRRPHTNVFVFAAGDNMKRLCRNPMSPGCVVHTPPTGVPIYATRIVLPHGVEFKANLPHVACTEVFVLAMHEAGHALGLGDTTSADPTSYGKWPSVMSQSVYSNCEPTALDVAALKAVYQSRQ